MGRNKLKQMAAAVLVVLLAATPLAGAVCTMSCSDGGGACCCESPGGLGTVQYTAESCCGPEASSPAAANLTAERLTSGTQVGQLSAAGIDAYTKTIGPAMSGQGVTAPASGQARGRSSPLFLLNVSFLI